MCIWDFRFSRKQFRKLSRRQKKSLKNRRRTLFQERENSYAALADLDEDYETGKLSDADYQELREELLQETARVIMQLENESLSDVEAEIERFKQQQREI